MPSAIGTESGMKINPIASINDLLSNTSFQQDEVVQGHLQDLGTAFFEISKTKDGQNLIVSMEGLARRIKVNT